MGDDVTVVVPSSEEEPELDQIGMELVRLLESCQTRIDQLVAIIGELNARISILESAISEHRHDSYAESIHTHEGFADAGHGHDGYALAEHAHTPAPEERKPDKRPESQHWYFKPIGT